MLHICSHYCDIIDDSLTAAGDLLLVTREASVLVIFNLTATSWLLICVSVLSIHSRVSDATVPACYPLTMVMIHINMYLTVLNKGTENAKRFIHHVILLQKIVDPNYNLHAA